MDHLFSAENRLLSTSSKASRGFKLWWLGCIGVGLQILKAPIQCIVIVTVSLAETLAKFFKGTLFSDMVRLKNALLTKMEDEAAQRRHRQLLCLMNEINPVEIAREPLLSFGSELENNFGSELESNFGSELEKIQAIPEFFETFSEAMHRLQQTLPSFDVLPLRSTGNVARTLRMSANELAPTFEVPFLWFPSGERLIIRVSEEVLAVENNLVPIRRLQKQMRPSDIRSRDLLSRDLLSRDLPIRYGPSYIVLGDSFEMGKPDPFEQFTSRNLSGEQTVVWCIPQRPSSSGYQSGVFRLEERPNLEHKVVHCFYSQNVGCAQSWEGHPFIQRVSAIVLTKVFAGPPTVYVSVGQESRSEPRGCNSQMVVSVWNKFPERSQEPDAVKTASELELIAVHTETTARAEIESIQARRVDQIVVVGGQGLDTLNFCFIISVWL